MKFYISYLKFDDYSPYGLIYKYNELLSEKKKCFTVTPNLDILRNSYYNKNYRKILNNADVSTIDGKSLIWLAKIEKEKHLKYKISGSDLTPLVLQLANQRRSTVAFFGGKEGVGIKAAENIKKVYKNINVGCVICPKLGYEKDSSLCLNYIEQINNSHSDIVFLCTGSPKTEFFYSEYQNLFNNALYFSVGATIDFLAGNIKRAPKFISGIGLEWLYRLSKDPKRLFKRYFKDILFFFKIFFISIFNPQKIKEKINEVQYKKED